MVRGHERRLRAPALVEHRVVGDEAGDRAPCMQAIDVQREIDMRHAGAGAEQPLVLGQHRAELELHRGVAAAEQLAEPPAGGCAAPVEQAAFGQQEAAAAIGRQRHAGVVLVVEEVARDD